MGGVRQKEIKRGNLECKDGETDGGVESAGKRWERTVSVLLLYF